jgi:hypothetical protein
MQVSAGQIWAAPVSAAAVQSTAFERRCPLLAWRIGLTFPILEPFPTLDVTGSRWLRIVEEAACR